MNNTGVEASGANGLRPGSHPAMKRIVILGGGFGGVYTARRLEQLLRRRPDVEIVLVSRDNFPLLMTPLLFEVFSGTLDFRHCSFPIRAFLRTTRFGEALVRGIDLDRRVVHPASPAGGDVCGTGLRAPWSLAAWGHDQPRHDSGFGRRLHVQNTRRRPSCSATMSSSMASSGPTWRPIRAANADCSPSSS